VPNNNEHIPLKNPTQNQLCKELFRREKPARFETNASGQMSAMPIRMDEVRSANKISAAPNIANKLTHQNWCEQRKQQTQLKQNAHGQVSTSPTRADEVRNANVVSTL
jgi:hypothetical protein